MGYENNITPRPIPKFQVGDTVSGRGSGTKYKVLRILNPGKNVSEKDARYLCLYSEQSKREYVTIHYERALKPVPETYTVERWVVVYRNIQSRKIFSPVYNTQAAADMARRRIEKAYASEYIDTVHLVQEVEIPNA